MFRHNGKNSSCSKIIGTIVLAIFLRCLISYAEDLKTVSIGEFAAGTEGWEFYLGKEFPGAEGNLWQEPKEGCKGAGAAALEGNFSSGGNYVAMIKNFNEPLNLQEVSLQVKTQDLTDFVIRLMDSTNQAFQLKTPLSDNNDWQSLSISIKDLEGKKLMTSWGGANDGKWHGPAKGISIVLDKHFLKVKEVKKGLMLVDKIELKVASSNQAPDKANAPLAPIAGGKRIFSTGHSFHTGFASVLDEISKSAGLTDSSIVGISSIGGSKVIQHWDRKEVQAALTAGTVDVLMTTPIYLPDPGVEKFAQLGFEHNPDFRLTMMEFWLPFDQYEPRNYVSGPEHVSAPNVVDHNASTGDNLRKTHEQYFREMDEFVSSINKKFGKHVVFVVPAGQAVIALREKIIKGQAPGLKFQEDIFADGLGHPKAPLTILMGYCHYAVIYHRSPVGLPVPKALGNGKTAEELNRMLQDLAWDAVTHHPLSGVKVESSSP